MDLSLKTLDELQAELVALSTQLGIISDQRNEYLKEIEKRQRAAKARVRLSILSPQERDALRQELGE